MVVGGSAWAAMVVGGSAWVSVVTRSRPGRVRPAVLAHTSDVCTPTADILKKDIVNHVRNFDTARTLLAQEGCAPLLALGSRAQES